MPSLTSLIFMQPYYMWVCREVESEQLWGYPCLAFLIKEGVNMIPVYKLDAPLDLGQVVPRFVEVW